MVHPADQNINWILNFLWGIADDVLRDLYVRGKYRDVILPMVVLQRLDAVLDATKANVLKMHANLDAKGVANQESALRQASGYPFYNTSKFSLKALRNRGNQQQLRADFEDWLNGFSKNVQDILENFEFRNQVSRLSKANALGALIEKFLDPNLKLASLDNHAMGTVFEELVRKFNEDNNEEAGDHWTPRDVVKLMANLIFRPIADQITSGTYLLYDAAIGTGGMLTVAEQTLRELAEASGKKVATHLYGQEINKETYAICKADLLLSGEGEEADNGGGGYTGVRYAQPVGDKNEATARIKINKMLETTGWRFFPDGDKPANIQLEPSITIKLADLDALGDDFEKTAKGYADFLLLDAKGFPCMVIEAKSESKNPLVGKEQSRKYARSQNCRLVILSNGNLHYLWDLERGNPYVITSFPTPDSATGYQKVTPNPQRLIEEQVSDDYIALTQRPNYRAEAAWQNEAERPGYIQTNRLRFLRPYQINAIHYLQRAVNDGNDRFLFEMATGTGKTLIAAAVIKLFLRSGNASRVLFLVDRLELEDQAKKVFAGLLSSDFQTVVFKENRDDWRRAEIVVTTVQSLLFNNKYQDLFSPTDFDLVISDEAHRSIGGNARAVFDFFIGYKLGLTATPRDYLKKYEISGPTTRDPRETERRLLLDTYRTFGCENGQPTFRYSLLDGVKEGFLINPTVVDARTVVTTELLSEEGFVASFTDDTGEDQQEAFKQREFEKRFFSEATNQLLCKTFLENALRDPVSGEIGKSIIFAVSQNHAAKLTQILNQIADLMFPGKYQSDFAVQVTSQIQDAQQFTINFANNNLLGSSNFLPTYKTSKARVCVTVGMMTTGYDCPDILNLGLFRPIFSPTDFIQIKGRGTRKHNFLEQLFDNSLKDGVTHPHKTAYKLFDFFANCEYFETEFNYDEVLKLPRPSNKSTDLDDSTGQVVVEGAYEHLGADILAGIKEETIGYEGMKIDRMFFERFEDAVRGDEAIVQAIEAGQWDRVIDYVNREVFDKPEEYYTLDKLRKAAAIDRRLTLREILEKVFGLIPRFKSKDELLEEEFAKFVADHKPEEAVAIPAIKTFFKAYVSSDQIRHIIESRNFTDLATNPAFSTRDYRAVPEKYRTLIPEYVKDYVTLNQFAA